MRSVHFPPIHDAGVSEDAGTNHWFLWRRSPVLDLTKAEVMASGNERICYIHPHDPSKCIKVAKTRHGLQHHREFRYFRWLYLRKTPWIHIPEFHGRIQTNTGPGNVFSIVRDFDGRISLGLTEAARTMSHSLLQIAAREFKDHFYRWQIITCDMNAGNFLVQRIAPDHIRLVMIDGIGNREFIPISTFIPFFREMKVHRRLKKFENKFSRILAAAMQSPP